MKQSTILLFGGMLGLLIFCSLLIWQQHQMALMHVNLGEQLRQHNSPSFRRAGAQSMQSKKAFWKLGIDCQDVYEVQGYESHEALWKMFSLTQYQLVRLNPRMGAEPKRGDILCIKGVYDITTHGMTWFWPALLGGILLAAGGGALAVQKIRKGGGDCELGRERGSGGCPTHGCVTPCLSSPQIWSQVLLRNLGSWEQFGTLAPPGIRDVRTPTRTCPVGRPAMLVY
ncbi:MAG: hypothetical protein WDW38_002121 [Sanguina aurantia]